MTRPYTRACRQTNFSKGGFVNKVPFLFYFFLYFFYLLSLPFLTFFTLLYPLQHVACLGAQFEVALSNGLCGDIFTRNVMDARTHRQTDR